jgi:hypothetical protein
VITPSIVIAGPPLRTNECPGDDEQQRTGHQQGQLDTAWIDEQTGLWS